VWFDQLDPIAKRVVHVAAVAADKRLIFCDRVSGLFQFRHHVVKTVNDERRVCFARWNEILLDTEMNLKRATFKPAATALNKLRWFGFFGQAEHAVVKCPRLVFAPSRHRN
jgi:hypothetical protein